MNPIIAVEGISFAGKTTLTKLLRLQSFARLYELSEKFEYGVLFPHFPKNTAEAKQSDLWFIEQEIARECDARLMATKSPVIADRSFVSGLSFGYARARIFALGDTNYQHNKIKQAIERGDLHTPWFVHLKSDINLFFERKRKDNERRIKEYGKEAVKHVTIPKYEKEFIEKELEFYIRFFSRVPHLELDARINSYELAAQLKIWSHKLNAPFSSIDLEDLMVKPADEEI